MAAGDGHAAASGTNMETEYAGDGPSGYGRSNAEDVPASYRIPDERWDLLQAVLPETLAEVGPAPVSLQWPACTAEQAVAAMCRDGFVIIRNAVPDATCDALLRQLQPHIDRTGFATDDGLGKTTRRTGAVRFSIDFRLSFGCFAADYGQF